MQTTVSPPKEPQKRSFWQIAMSTIFDVRVIGVLGQIIFIVLVIFGVKAITGNFAQNAKKLGESQFICRDGTFSYRCAYDFMDSESGFDIADTMIEYVNTDPYWRAIEVGVLNTLKVAIFGVILTAILGTFAGIARLSDNWLLNKLALWYVELVRNTPLLIQIFFVYFGVILIAPELGSAKPLLGLPIYFSRRGLNIPSFALNSSAAIFVAFLILGIIQFQVLWVVLSRREERTGQAANRWQTGIIGFIIVIGLGWVISSNVAGTQGLMVPNNSRIEELGDIEKIMLQRTGLNYIGDIDTLTEDEISAAAWKICVLKDSVSEPNLINQLSKMGIPFDVTRSNRYDQATKNYADAKCDAYAAPTTVLAAERATLENPASHRIISIKESPIVWSIPRLDGLNMVGGARMKPEFTALLLALVLFYGGLLAEIVRAGIQSVSKGQSEAARALGLTESQRLQLIVLPQALRVIIPPGIGVALSLAKDTSLGIAIGFPDMYAVAYTTMNQSGRVLQLFVLIMLVYMLISLGFSVILNWYNEKIKLVER